MKELNSDVFVIIVTKPHVLKNIKHFLIEQVSTFEKTVSYFPESDSAGTKAVFQRYIGEAQHLITQLSDYEEK